MELKSPDMFENRPRLTTGRGGMFICSKLGQNLSEMEDICKDTESNLGPFAGF